MGFCLQIRNPSPITREPSDKSQLRNFLQNARPTLLQNATVMKNKERQNKQTNKTNTELLQTKEGKESQQNATWCPRSVEPKWKLAGKLKSSEWSLEFGEWEHTTVKFPHWPRSVWSFLVVTLTTRWRNIYKAIQKPNTLWVLLNGLYFNILSRFCWTYCYTLGDRSKAWHMKGIALIYR